VALLVTICVAYLQYRLVKIPLPIDLEATSRFNLPPLLLGQSALIIDGPLKNPSENTLISHDGRPNELLTIRLDKARLEETTVEDLKSNDSYSPAAAVEGRIRYTDEGSRPEDTKSEPCRTNFRIETPSNRQPPQQIRFFQLGTPGLQRERQLEVQASEEVLISILAVAGETDDAEAQGCHKLLEVGSWSQKFGPGTEVSAVAAPNSGFRFSFTPMKETNSLWSNAADFYDALDLGVPQQQMGDPPPVVRAAAISIRTTDGRMLFSARRANDTTFVQLNKLEIGSDRLRVTLSGKGFVTLNDEVITSGLYERIKDNQILAALVGLANAALVGWITRIIRKRPALVKP